MSASDFELIDDLDPELDLSIWAELPTAEVAYRLRRPEREARQAKTAIGRPVRLDYLDGGLRDRPKDIFAFLDALTAER